MYDFVTVLVFDDNTNMQIVSFAHFLESYGIETVRKLPPHITIDLYENLSSDVLISTIDCFIDEISSIPFRFIKLDNFDNEVLFLKPDNVEAFESVKSIFDTNLGDYSIKDNANRGIYNPHMTLVSSSDTTEAERILNEQFYPFESNASGLCVYSKNKQLVKRYDLK